eukprot:858297-Pelagomonas_calceolata.AAC.4
MDFAHTALQDVRARQNKWLLNGSGTPQDASEGQQSSEARTSACQRLCLWVTQKKCWPIASQQKQELLRESWRNQDALGMKIDSSW